MAGRPEDTVVTETRTNVVTQTGSSSASRPNDSSAASPSSSSSSDSRSSATPSTSDDPSSSTTSSTATTSTRTKSDDVDEDSSTSSDTTTSSSSDTETSKSTSTTSSSETSSTETTTSKESSSSKHPATTSEDTTSRVKPPASETTTSEPSLPTSKKPDSNSGLGTGSIIGISVAALTAAGVVLLLLGALLRWRRKKALEKRTAHLKRASEIWDFADSHGADVIEAANEKEAAAGKSKGGGGSFRGPAPFTPRAHTRQGSQDSAHSAGHETVASRGAADTEAGGFPPASMMQTSQSAPQAPYFQPASSMQRMANRLSSIGLYPGGQRGPMPVPRPFMMPAPMPGMYGVSPNAGQMHANADTLPPPLDRQDSFGNRVHQPVRNNFFPQPAPQMMPYNGPPHPLAFPGAR